MAIKIKTQIGNLLRVRAGHIVHGCNAQGIMGSGVALGIKQNWPHVFENYLQIYNEGGLALGEAYPVVAIEGLIVWNAITQNNFGSGARFISYDAIETCFAEVNKYITSVEFAKEKNTLYSGNCNIVIAPPEVHIPLIGAGRGGGNWNIISTIIEETMDFPVTLWLPDSTVTTR